MHQAHHDFSGISHQVVPSDKIDLFDGVEANSPPLQGVTIRVVIRLAAPPPPSFPDPARGAWVCDMVSVRGGDAVEVGGLWLAVLLPVGPCTTTHVLKLKELAKKRLINEIWPFKSIRNSSMQVFFSKASSFQKFPLSVICTNSLTSEKAHISCTISVVPPPVLQAHQTCFFFSVRPLLGYWSCTHHTNLSCCCPPPPLLPLSTLHNPTGRAATASRQDNIIS